MSLASASCHLKPVAKIKCWHLTFLQTTDTLNLYVYLLYQHLYNGCHVTFRLRVCDYDYHLSGGDGGGVTPRWLPGERPLCFLFQMTKLGIFNETSGHFLTVFVTEKNRYFKPKHDLFLCLNIDLEMKFQHIPGFQKCIMPTFILWSGLINCFAEIW